MTFELPMIQVAARSSLYAASSMDVPCFCANVERTLRQSRTIQLA